MNTFPSSARCTGNEKPLQDGVSPQADGRDSGKSGAPVLFCQNVTKSYQGERIIEDISVKLEPGELVSILGASGTGKTTLFHALSGLEIPDSGRVYYRGEDVTGSAGHVSYMQQKDLLLPFRTILDNVCVPLYLRGVEKKLAREEARGYFGEFGLERCEDKYPSQLSGGMRQRAALLRSYLFQGKVMLLDEPFSALDAITKSAMHQWFQSVRRKRGTSAFFVSHDIDEAILLSDRIYIISGAPGTIRAEISIKEAGPRDSEFTVSPRFMDYKRQILSYIKGDA